MRIARISAALLLTGLLPAFAQAASYPVVSGGHITRAEFVQLVIQRTGDSFSGYTNCFSDVRTQTFAPYICTAKQRGIVTGNPDGTFRPDTPISFVEASAVIVRAEGVHVSSSGLTWYAPYLQQMSEWNAVPASVHNILDMINYIQAQEMITAAMDGDDDFDDDDDDDNDNSDSDDELELSISVSDDTVEPGDRVTFRIRLQNEDDDDIDDIKVIAELDDDMKFISASDDGDEDDDEVEWDDIEVEEDETTTLLLTVEIDDRADDGDTLRLRVRSEGLSVTEGVRVDDDDDNDDDRLDISITDSADPVDAGELLTYTIRVENEDDDDIRVDVLAVLDEDTHFVSASHDGDESRDEVEWDDIRIDEDEIVTLSLTVRVDSDARDGRDIRLTVEANDEEDTETTEVENDDDDDDDNDDDEDVRIVISDSKDPVREGDTVIYRIELENDENDDIEIDVRAELDDGMTFLSATHDGDEDNDVVEWENIEIDEDEHRILLLTVRINGNVDDGETLRLRVEAGDGTDTETTRVND